ncbi:cation transporter [Campylobacter upsaliensis]|uniref:cation transporter n=1 Tax=Campylobacter upsaliensis TaxID=28080 RepID=UPI0022EB5714|nr:cation transporter [Campylobacter upsaliensis]HEF3574591.1 cation transporter [Campylobacter upsaliensis]
MKFKVANVNCIKCVNLIKNSLEDTFGVIEIDLEAKILSVNLQEKDKENFEKELNELGFEILEQIK